MDERNEIFAFGAFRLDVRAETLTTGGTPVPLTPKAFAMLVLLVRNRGRVMTREELMNELWPDTLVTEANLSQNVFVLRQALGEDAKAIETVPRRGYRFVAPVAVSRHGEGEPPPRAPAVSAPAGGDAPELAGSPSAAAATLARPGTGRLVPALAILATLLVVGAVLGILAVRHARRVRANARPSIAIVGLQDLSGDERSRWLATALPEMLDAELAAGGALRLVPGESVIRMKRDGALPEGITLSSDTLARLRAALNADYAVTGSYLRLAADDGPKLRLQVKLQDTATGDALVAHTETGSDSELFEVVARTAAVLRGRLAAGMVSDEQRAGLRRSVPARAAARETYYEALARLRSLDEKGAIPLLERTVDEEPGFAPAHAALAEAWSALGYDTKALEAARRAVEGSSALPREEALVTKARASQASARWQEAIESWEALWSFFPDEAEYGLGLATALCEAGQGPRALEVVRQLRELAPSDPRVSLAEARAADAVSDFDRSIAAADRAAADAARAGSDTGSARALLWKAVSLARKGRTDDAIPLFTEAARLFRRLGDENGAARAANGLGNVLADKGDPASARAKYQEALAAAERTGHVKLAATVSNNLGILAKDRGDLEGALAAYDRADRFARDAGLTALHALVLGNRGVALRDLGRLSEARAVLLEGLEVNRARNGKDGICTALLNLADTAFRAGDLAFALKTGEEAARVAREIGHAGNEGGALEGLAEVQAWSGRTEEAQRSARAAVELREKHGQAAYAASARSTLASVLLAAGDAAGAATAAREAADRFRSEGYPGDEALALTRLAVALAGTGKRAEAAEALARARTLVAPLQTPWSRTSVWLAEARLAAIGGDAKTSAGAARAALEEAHRFGFLPLELDARLLLARNGAPGGEPLTRVAEAARRAGFGLVAAAAERPER